METIQTPTSTPKQAKKKVYKNFAEGRLYVVTSFNNTITTITDPKGNSLAWASTGTCGFKGARRSTPFAAGTAIDKVLEEAKKYGIKKLSVYIKGPGTGRDAVLRSLRSKRDFDVDQVADITPMPHNGPRPPKARRV